LQMGIGLGRVQLKDLVRTTIDIGLLPPIPSSLNRGSGEFK